MLDTFLEDFSQEYFLKWQLPKCEISRAATSQVWPSRGNRPPACSSHSARPQQSILAVALGIHCTLRRLRELINLTFGKLPFGKLHIWEVATWEKSFWKVPITPFQDTIKTTLFIIKSNTNQISRILCKK